MGWRRDAPALCKLSALLDTTLTSLGCLERCSERRGARSVPLFSIHALDIPPLHHHNDNQAMDEMLEKLVLNSTEGHMYIAELDR